MPACPRLDQLCRGVERPGQGPGIGRRDRGGVLSLLPFVPGSGTDRHVEPTPGQVNGDRFADPRLAPVTRATPVSLCVLVGIPGL